MKWMIASDIHGSAYWCEKMLEAFDREQADRLILLGDLLYHGPRNPLPLRYDPAEVARLLNARRDKLLCVHGNCDSQVDQMVLDFPIEADYAVLSWDDRLIYLTHGHIHGFDAPPSLQPGDLLIHGHTHVPICKPMEQFIYINPGSVSLPKEDSPNSYLLLDKGVFHWMDLNGTNYMSYEIRSASHISVSKPERNCD